MPIHSRDTGEGNTFEVQLGDGRWLQINERRTKDGGFVSVGTDITPLKQQVKLFFLLWSKQAFGIRIEPGTVNIQHMA